MTQSERHRRQIVDRLLAGANVHEIVAHLCGDDGVSEYHLGMANVMREAAVLLGEQLSGTKNGA